MSLDFFANTSNWTDELFGVKKPIIAMCHLLPLPSDPYYDEEGGMEKVIERATKDVIALQNGGVDGIMFSNEYSLPYLTKMEPITLAAMAYVIGRVKEYVKIPYGVNCLWDPIASLDVAKAVDEIKKGKVTYRVDKEGNVNLAIGKTSFTDEALVENFNAIFNTIAKARPATVKGAYMKNLVVSTTMGPGIHVEIVK